MSTPDLTIAVPALNEEQRIGGTLQGLLEGARQVPDRRLEILAVDDGSTDRTAAIIAQLAQQHPEIRLLKNPRNLGLGASIRRALTEARGARFLIVPGDNDLPAPTLAALFRHAHAADMVMCYFPDRQLRGPGRRLLSALFGSIYTTCFDVHVQYINGPCVYPVARLRELELFATRFSIVAEINVKLLRQGLSFVEIPSHRQIGLAGSSSLSLRNLREVAAVFLRLCYEVHVQQRRRYRQRPVRVPLAAGLTSDDAAGTATPLASWVYALLQPGGHSPLVRWMLAGGVFMGLSTLFLYLAVGLLGLPVMAGTLVTAELCTILRYLVNDHWVFGHRRPAWSRLWQYHVANGAAFVIWWAATNIMNLLGIHYLLAGIFAVGFSTGFSMGTNFLWIWRKKHHLPAP